MMSIIAIIHIRRYLLTWNGEEITGINGYLFYSQKIFCARRAFPEGSKRMYCFDLAATVLFLHSDFHLQLTFIWAESCTWQHLSPCVCGYSKSRVIQELNYHVCFPSALSLDRSDRRKIPKSKNEYASTSQLHWFCLGKHSNSSNQRLPSIFKLRREYEDVPIFGIYLDAYQTELCSICSLVTWS